MPEFSERILLIAMSISDWTGGGSRGFGSSIATTNCSGAGGTLSAITGGTSLPSRLFFKRFSEEDFVFGLEVLLLLVVAGLTASISMSSESSELSDSLSDVFMTAL